MKIKKIPTPICIEEHEGKCLYIFEVDETLYIAQSSSNDEESSREENV